jgi:hydroxyacylglutathione hydrolase
MMFFKKMYTPGLAIYSYLLGDETTKECIVVDPIRHVAPYIIHAQNAGLDIVAILETHVHADFISGAKELKHQLNDKPKIYASSIGEKESIPLYADVLVDNTTEIEIGDLRLCALHTPGHTPEHLCWICFDKSRSSEDPWFAFTGDCLFVGSVGRPDLLGEKYSSDLSEKMYHTLFETFSSLPNFLEIFPSHGEGSLCGKGLKTRANSTLGYERLHNPYLQKKPLDEWKKHLLEEQAPFPPYFNSTKKKNLTGPVLISTLKTYQWENEKEKPALENLFLLDVRHPEVFALSYLPNSINIPFSSSFSQWVGWMLPENQPIGLIMEEHQISTEIVEQLRTIGFDQDIWLMPYLQVTESPAKQSTFGIMEADELAKLGPEFSSFFILDVRTPEEWNEGHIAGSHHIELTSLERSLDQLPRYQSIAIVCRSGQRASLAGSLLIKNGFQSVLNVRGGIQSWKQLGYALTSPVGRARA